MNKEPMILQALESPLNAISYGVSQHLATSFPEKAIIEGSAGAFDLDAYTAAGQCKRERKAGIHHQITTAWNGPGKGLSNNVENAWFEVSWQGHSLDVLILSWTEGSCKSAYYWILADIKEVAENFYYSVCEWDTEVRAEVLVFDGGYWYKSEELYQSIKDATFDNLILRGSLKQEIQDDFASFFSSRAVYERYRIPWKRGVLFLGSPGNGKTHTVKALINGFGQPCLYVKSFRSPYGTDHDNIRRVFHRARQTTPCVLVLEDLDSLIDNKNRSFFLNELDGFASNKGIVTLATTNHPERLDPAILERPSRFDRKYTFDLPGPEERLAYIARWSDSVEPDLRVDEPFLMPLVAATDGFSFAYLKELFVSSMMRWIAAPRPGAMGLIMSDQVDVLRAQMSSMNDDSCPVPVDEDEEEDS